MLRQQVLQEQGQQITMGQQSPAPPLTMTADLAFDLSRKLILDEDILRTVEHCERTGHRLLHQETGHFIGHLDCGIITYWVEYELHEDGYIIHNAYSHRMTLQE